VADEYIERISPYLISHGITDFRFEKMAKHRAVTIPYKGRSYRVVFPLTGSDWRGPANTISTIRHVLGLFEPKMAPADGVRRMRRKTAVHHVQPAAPKRSPEPTQPRPDRFFGPLMILKARLEAAQVAAEINQAADTVPPAGKPTRVALRTPWLGRQTRYVTM
jgi:hypothetical protein